MCTVWFRVIMVSVVVLIRFRYWTVGGNPERPLTRVNVHVDKCTETEPINSVSKYQDPLLFPPRWTDSGRETKEISGLSDCMRIIIGSYRNDCHLLVLNPKTKVEYELVGK